MNKLRFPDLRDGGVFAADEGAPLFADAFADEGCWDGGVGQDLGDEFGGECNGGHDEV